MTVGELIEKSGGSNYLLSELVIDGIEPTPEYKALWEKEKRGKLTAQEIAEIVHRPHGAKPEDGNSKNTQ